MYMQTETRMTYKSLLDGLDANFTEYHLRPSSPFNHNTNKAVTDRLINEVKANNPKFSKSDIRVAAYIYYKSLCQEQRLIDSVKQEDRKIQRRRRERVNRKLTERMTQF